MGTSLQKWSRKCVVGARRINSRAGFSVVIITAAVAPPLAGIHRHMMCIPRYLDDGSAYSDNVGQPSRVYRYSQVSVLLAAGTC
jgi:hypothetical protein